MTIQERAIRRTADSDPSHLVAGCRRTGNWEPAAAWLVVRLNEIEGRRGTIPLDFAGRLARNLAIDSCVALVDGDRPELDLVVLLDGTRVVWELGTSPGLTRWLVEAGAARSAP